MWDWADSQPEAGWSRNLWKESEEEQRSEEPAHGTTLFTLKVAFSYASIKQGRHPRSAWAAASLKTDQGNDPIRAWTQASHPSRGFMGGASLLNC